MNKIDEILIRLGRIEGELVSIRTLSVRVLMLEHWQNWLKGACAFLAASFAYLYKRT